MMLHLRNILNVSFCNVLHRFANVMDLQLLITTLLIDDVGYENFIVFLIFRKNKEKKTNIVRFDSSMIIIISKKKVTSAKCI